MDFLDDEIENLDTARDFTVKGQMGDPNTVFLKLHMEDTTGHLPISFSNGSTRPV